ncbi:hypothetical protein Syun_031200 [Stephania yunnanensis]|uniref:Cytochrome b5 heme-binding domain-containing protein n=1 Tax=Stephania yunnanensis TaxID=152371 RepID=A0AAP0DVD1_9MAGN
MGLMEVVEAYTGLSPTAFFTILALMVGVYKLVSSMFVDPEQDSKPHLRRQQQEAQAREAMASMATAPVPDPVQLGEVTEEQLRGYDGSDPQKPLLMAIKGHVYDISRSRMFYGPGGPYSLFAGRDASRALALMSFDSKDLTGNLEGLRSSELEVLQDWEYKFMEKYAKVGQLVSGKTNTGDSSAQETRVENQESEREAKAGSLDLNNKTAAEAVSEGS